MTDNKLKRNGICIKVKPDFFCSVKLVSGNYLCPVLHRYFLYVGTKTLTGGR